MARHRLIIMHHMHCGWDEGCIKVVGSLGQRQDIDKRGSGSNGQPKAIMQQVSIRGRTDIEWVASGGPTEDEEEGRQAGREQYAQCGEIKVRGKGEKAR